jgi:hypothetical protein
MELAYLLNPAFQYENRNGRPLVGGFLKVFEHGTTIPYITWKNFDGDRNPAEIPLNDLGMAVVLAEPGKLYDIFCYDINRVEQWSRVNVGTYGGSGGASGGASGSGVSAIRCTGVSRLTTDGNFRYSVEEATGSALEVSSGVLTADAAWYHYDATVRLIWESEPLNRETQVKLAAYLNDDLASDVTSFDMGFTHDGTVRVSGEVKVTADDTVFNITVTGMPAGMEAQLVDFGMHTLNSQGGSGGGTYVAGRNIVIDPSTDTISYAPTRAWRSLHGSTWSDCGDVFGFLVEDNSYDPDNLITVVKGTNEDSEHNVTHWGQINIAAGHAAIIMTSVTMYRKPDELQPTLNSIALWYGGNPVSIYGARKEFLYDNSQMCEVVQQVSGYIPATENGARVTLGCSAGVTWYDFKPTELWVAVLD